jgi:hypothetical protein
MLWNGKAKNKIGLYKSLKARHAIAPKKSCMPRFLCFFEKDSTGFFGHITEIVVISTKNRKKTCFLRDHVL